MSLSSPISRGSATATSNANAVTGAFTPGTDELLVAIVGGQAQQGAPLTEPVVSGGSLTWTKVASTYKEGEQGGWTCWVQFWIAIGLGASMTVTSNPGNNGQNGHFLSVQGFTGQDLVTPTGAIATGSDVSGARSGTFQITLNGAPASTSQVLAVVSVDNFEDTPADVIIAGTGWTNLNNFDSAGSETHGQTQHRGASTSTTVLWNDILSSNVLVTSAVEIKEAAAGTQNLTPSLYTDTDTFFTPTVGRGAIALTPSLFTDGDTFFTPTVSSVYSLTPALYADDDTFFSPSVTVGVVNLTPALFTDDDTFFTPVVASTYALTPSLYTDDDTFFSPTAGAGAVALTPDLFTDSDTFFSPTVAPGLVNLTPDIFVDVDTFFNPTVELEGGTQDLAPALYADTDTFFTPTVAAGAVTLAPDLFTNTNVFFTPVVATLYGLTPALYVDADVFFTPSISVGVVALLPSLFVSSSIFYNPLVRAGGWTTEAAAANAWMEVAGEESNWTPEASESNTWSEA